MQLAKEKNQDDKSIIVLQVEEVMGEGIAPAGCFCAGVCAGRFGIGCGRRIRGGADAEEEFRIGSLSGSVCGEGRRQFSQEAPQEPIDEEITILDKIFGNPKLIFIILASIVVIILLIVLLTSLGGRGGENSSTNHNSSSF